MIAALPLLLSAAAIERDLDLGVLLVWIGAGALAAGIGWILVVVARRRVVERALLQDPSDPGPDLDRVDTAA